MRQILKLSGFFLGLALIAPVPAWADAYWSGLYGGINAGAAVDASDYKLSPTNCPTGACGGTTSSNSLRTDRGDLDGVFFTGGAQLGYNFLFGRILLGLEGDFDIEGTGDKQGVKRSLASPLTGTFSHTVTQRLDWYGTLRGRAGYSFDRFLPYLTAGFAYGQVATSANATFSSAGDNYSGNSKAVKPGWTVGAGLDYALSNQWSIRAEYLYIDLGNSTYNMPITNAAATGVSSAASYQNAVDTQQHVVRLALNFRFAVPQAPPAPVPAPAAAPAPRAAPQPRVFIVFFEFDKSTLTPDGQKVVDAAAAAYKQGGNPQIQLAGYTDLAGTAAYNLRLSQRRADTVSAALVRDGVPSNVIVSHAYGKTNPRVPTADGVREPQNRRVEINL